MPKQRNGRCSLTPVKPTMRLKATRHRASYPSSSFLRISREQPHRPERERSRIRNIRLTKTLSVAILPKGKPYPAAPRIVLASLSNYSSLRLFLTLENTSQISVWTCMPRCSRQIRVENFQITRENGNVWNALLILYPKI